MWGAMATAALIIAGCVVLIVRSQGKGKPQILTKGEFPMFRLDDLRLRALDSRELLRSFVVLHRGGSSPTITLRSEAAYEATVEGSEGRYGVRVDARLQGSCDCIAFARSKKKAFCKHVAALAFIWLRDAGITVTVRDVAPELAELVDKLSLDECRHLILEAAGIDKKLHARLTSGEWPTD